MVRGSSGASSKSGCVCERKPSAWTDNCHLVLVGDHPETAWRPNASVVQGVGIPRLFRDPTSHRWTVAAEIGSPFDDLTTPRTEYLR